MVTYGCIAVNTIEYLHLGYCELDTNDGASCLA
jgi:hypothetical protein